MRYLLIISVLFLSSCSDWRYTIIPPTPIESIFMHKHGSYSVAVMKDDVYTVIPLPRTVIRMDAVDKAFYECDYRHDNFYGTKEGTCIVHLLSSNQVHGGAWSNGKFGSGKTIKIK